MNDFQLNAEPRVDQGKGASRRLRRAGKVPAVLYGAGQPAVNLQLDHMKLMHQSLSEAFYSHILTLKLGADSERVVLKAMQRHPVRPLIMHVDLLRVAENEALTMRVPIHFVNEDQCVGVRTGGGQISHLMSDVEIVCLPKDLPEYIEVDVAELDMNDIIHIGDLELPAGVQIASLLHGGDPAQPVVSVHATRTSEAPEAAPEEGAAAPAAATPPPAA